MCPEEMEHNTNLFSHESFLVLPVLQFFALPDYCFEEIEVPPWVYDKRLSPDYDESTAKPDSAPWIPDVWKADDLLEASAAQMPTSGGPVKPSGKGGAPRADPEKPNLKGFVLELPFMPKAALAWLEDDSINNEEGSKRARKDSLPCASTPRVLPTSPSSKEKFQLAGKGELP